MKFSEIPKITIANYQVDILWTYLKIWLKQNNVNMNPDFQRNYVWTVKQKEEFINWILRGGQSGKDIYFNHPEWFRSFEGEMVIVDGKQRVSAVLDFLDNKVRAYGHFYSEYTDKISITQCSFKVHVANLKLKKDVIKWYLDMNTCGTYHTEEELQKVKKLYESL